MIVERSEASHVSSQQATLVQIIPDPEKVLVCAAEPRLVDLLAELLTVGVVALKQDVEGVVDYELAPVVHLRSFLRLGL